MTNYTLMFVVALPEGNVGLSFHAEGNLPGGSATEWFIIVPETIIGTLVTGAQFDSFAKDVIARDVSQSTLTQLRSYIGRTVITTPPSATAMSAR